MISFFPLWPSDLATFQQNCIYGLYISQLIRYSSIEGCGKNKGNYIPTVLDGKAKKKSWPWKFYSRLQDLPLRNVWVTNDMDMLHSRSHNHVILSSIMTYHRICNTNNTTDAISLFRTDYPSITYEFTLVFVCGFFLANSCFPIFTCLCSVLWTLWLFCRQFWFCLCILCLSI